jgi:hypothetical protein
MKTSERRAIADRALNQIDKLEMEIRAKMALNNIQGDLDVEYANFKTYSVLRDLHEQYTGWKQEYTRHADNANLVNLVGQSEHDILRENYLQLTSETQIITIPTTETVYFYERDTGTGQAEKVKYKLVFEKIKILPFYSYPIEALDSLFIRVNLAGMPS